MKKFALPLAALGLAAFASADPFSVVTSTDTSINGASAGNKDRAYGTAVAINTSLNANTGAELSSWFKFAAAPSVTGKTIQSVALNFFPTVIDPNTTVNFYFNTNASWLEATASGAANGLPQDSGSVTTPFLTFNDSGLPGSNNSRFLGSSILIGSAAFPNGNGGGANINHVQSIDLALGSPVVSALQSGQAFTIYARAASGRITVIANEGVGATGAPTGASALSLTGNYAPVPEPASMAVLGLGLAGVLRRRRK